MKVCTFFGHRDAPESIKPALRRAVTELIVEQGVDHFYVGNQGRFDRMVRQLLREMTALYPIHYDVVLAYFPKEDGFDYSDTLVPDGLEKVHPRYAISWRNKWMVEQSDYVISYVCRTFGGAAQFTEMARRKNKIVINLKE